MRKISILSITLIMSIVLLTGCLEQNISQESEGEISKADVVEIRQEEPVNSTPASPQADISEPDSPEKYFYDIQQSVDNGHQPWRINPEDVALEFATRTLNLEGTATLEWRNEKESARVIFTKQSGGEIHIDLYQPAAKGQGGIWEVEYWFDENSRLHQIRDLTALPPLFYNDENVPENIKEAVRSVVVKDWTETFGAYYNVLGFYADNVEYTVSDNMAEVKFLMTLVTQNFYKDPDTVAYIKEAKEKGSAHYQQLYDEYNMPRSGNVDLKATMLLDGSGEVMPDTIQVFSNISVKGEAEYAPVKAADFIIKE